MASVGANVVGDGGTTLSTRMRALSQTLFSGQRRCGLDPVHSAEVSLCADLGTGRAVLLLFRLKMD